VKPIEKNGKKQNNKKQCPPKSLALIILKLLRSFLAASPKVFQRFRGLVGMIVFLVSIGDVGPTLPW